MDVKKGTAVDAAATPPVKPQAISQVLLFGSFIDFCSKDAPLLTTRLSIFFSSHISISSI
jgi:hypothetical protein